MPPRIDLALPSSLTIATVPVTVDPDCYRSLIHHGARRSSNDSELLLQPKWQQQHPPTLNLLQHIPSHSLFLGSGLCL